MCGINCHTKFTRGKRTGTFAITDHGKRTEDVFNSIHTVTSRRGPEAVGIYSEKVPVKGGRYSIIHGHTKLGFVRESDNPQPAHYFHNGNHSVLNFNGEIYNWKTLATELAKDHGITAPETDTQTLLQGLVHEGTEFLKKLEGQFGFFAKINRDGQPELIFGRDRYGIVPLAFAEDPETKEVSVASTWEALRANGFTPEQMRTVPHGVIGRIMNGKVELERWAHIPDFEEIKDSTQKIDPRTLRKQMREAVISQIPEDTERHFFAMGGKDSASIVAIATRWAKKHGKKFGGAITIVPEDEPEGGDLPDVEKTLKELKKEGINIPHYTAVLTTKYAEERLDDLLRLLGPNYFNIACGLAEDLFAKVAIEQGGKSMMTAGGPDEAFNSYAHIYRMLKGKDLEFKRKVFDAINRQFPEGECIRAGLVLGEHGLENRVPYAFLTELGRTVPEEQKTTFDENGDPTDVKVIFKKALNGILPEHHIQAGKMPVHGASGGRSIISRIRNRDPEFKNPAKRRKIIQEIMNTDWKYLVSAPKIEKSDEPDLAKVETSEIAMDSIYLLHRWRKLEPELFAMTGEWFYDKPKAGTYVEPNWEDTPKALKQLSQAMQTREWWYPEGADPSQTVIGKRS